MSRKYPPIIGATPEQVVRALMKKDYPERRQVESDCKESDESEDSSDDED